MAPRTQSTRAPPNPAPFLQRSSLAESFDALGTMLLEEILQVLVTQTQGDDADWRPRRATLHFRPGGSYEALLARELDADARKFDPWTSASVWKSVSRRLEPLVMAVDDASLALIDGEDDSRVFASKRTRMKLEQGDTTHLAAIPLRREGQPILGMVSIEISCNDTSARLPGLQQTCQHLLTLADLVTSRLEQYREQPEPAVDDSHDAAIDEFAPAVGQRARKAFRLAARFAPGRRPVLITGPSGAGKTFLASALHQIGGRTGAFRTYSAKAFGADLQMVALVGARKGAPGFNPPLTQDREGLIEVVKHGTLFIDDVESLTRQCQSNLLDLLDDAQQFTRYGDTTPRPIENVRWVFATNARLEDNPEFRQDLLYRISVLRIHLPGLNERRDEIPRWAEHFAARTMQAEGRPARVTIDDDALAFLRDQDWSRGNLRALDGAVHRACLLAGERKGSVHVRRRDVIEAMPEDTAPAPDDLLERLRRFATDLTNALREHSNGNELMAYLRRHNVLAAALADVVLTPPGGSGRKLNNEDRLRAAEFLGLESAWACGNFAKLTNGDRRRLEEFAALLERHAQ
jgi:DNA-binding NtrC family response regulator